MDGLIARMAAASAPAPAPLALVSLDELLGLDPAGEAEEAEPESPAIVPADDTVPRHQLSRDELQASMPIFMRGVTDVKLQSHKLMEFPLELFEAGPHMHFLNMSRNIIPTIPRGIQRLSSLVELNLSRNQIDKIPREIAHLERLVRLDVSGNFISQLPAGFSRLKALRDLVLNGNLIERFPEDILDMKDMTRLYLGGNRLVNVPPEIGNLKLLELLYLGGNKLTELPETIGELRKLSVLYLGDNRLSSIPESVAKLQNLRTLNLHNNKLSFLPNGIIKMANLENLSLRGNPLVTDFINDEQSSSPLSLKEIAARAILNHDVPYGAAQLPGDLLHFLQSARRCNNPKCAGVYFSASVKRLTIEDFCGKFRVPLMKFLCREKCSTEPSYPHHPAPAVASPQNRKKMKQVLLTGYSEPDVTERMDLERS
mmetsp:Transcript_5919/g.15065  ORF Transcript_5919/g.15065 Transcript_5919/m.15065 type:complete len:427 (+) Transcript_5919:102-1382(+)